MHYFYFNGHKSSDFGLYISDKDIYSAPQRDLEFISVPGRSGDVLLDHGRFNNVEVSYTVSCKKLKEKAPAIRQWLSGSVGYLALMDSYTPGYYRYAVYASKLDIQEVISNVGTAKIVFNCKPFRYRTDGMFGIDITTNGTSIVNPEPYSASPQITIYGTGTISLHINRNTYTIKDVTSSVILDSELMSAYKGNILMNDKIVFTEFPILEPGENIIQWTGNVSHVIITPNWQTL